MKNIETEKERNSEDTKKKRRRNTPRNMITDTRQIHDG
jgi:hypothetical protein